jgi:hypothetical protein
MKNNGRPSRSWTVLQASQESPTLARLSELAAESAARLQCVAPLLPLGLRSSVKAGAVDGNVWCLVIDNNAAASKVRQFLPAIQAQLRSNGWETSEIRLKVRREA